MLTVLKIIGFVLLGIVGLILLFMLLIFFFPFGYSLSGAKPKEGSPYGKMAVWWLFHLLHASFLYDKEGPLLTLRVCGIPVYKTNFEEPEKKDGEEEKIEESGKTEGEDRENSEEASDDADLESNEEKEAEEEDAEEFSWEGTLENEEEEYELTDEEIEAYLNEPDEFDDLPLPKKIREILKKIKEYILKLKEKCYNLKKTVQDEYKKLRRRMKLLKHYWKLLNHPSVKPTLKFLIKLGKQALRHIWPRKIRIHAEYGTSDPQTCAKIYGYYCMIYPFFGKQIQFVPNFDEEVFAIDGYAKGRVMVFPFAWMGVRILLNRNVWKLLRLLRREVKRRGRK